MKRQYVEIIYDQWLNEKIEHSNNKTTNKGINNAYLSGIERVKANSL